MGSAGSGGGRGRLPASRSFVAAVVFVVALALVSGWAWAGVALRSGYREMPDFAAGLIASPMGSLPPGVLQMLTQGPDAVVVGALTVVLVASGIAVPTTMLLGIQAAAGAVGWERTYRSSSASAPGTERTRRP